MSDMNILSSLINDVLATQTVDMTEENTGGGGGLMPEGYAMARCVTYIELGNHTPVVNGETKAPTDMVKIGFKLFGGQDNCYDGRFISTFDLGISNNTKANAKRLFNRLNWAGDIKHFAQALGRAYLIPITIAKSKTTGKESNRINLDGILPPMDTISKAPYPVPEVTAADLKYFFFDKPTKETWDALFVEGSYDDGNSKNRIQEQIMTANNFPGSPLEQLISGVVLPDPATAVAAPTAPAVPASPAPAAPEVPAAVAPAMPAAPVVPAAPVMPAMPAAPVLPS